MISYYYKQSAIYLCIISALILSTIIQYPHHVKTIAKPTGVTRIIGTVSQIETLSHGVRILLCDPLIQNISLAETPRYIRLRHHQSPTRAQIGDVIQLLAVLRPSSKPLYPGTYDFAWAAKLQQIGAVGYGVSDITIVAPAENSLQQFRQELIQRFAHTRHGAIITALLFGERRAIHRDVLTEIRASGVAHLFAISGLHVALVCGWLYGFSRLVCIIIPHSFMRIYAKQVAALFSLIVSFGYVWLAGMPVSAQRAYVMASLFLLAIIFSRHVHPLRNVAIAAVIVLLYQPYSIFTPGFQMSFAAVTALIALISPYWKANPSLTFGWIARSKRFVLGIWLSSLIAGFATMPYAIYHFNHVATYGLIANMVAVPLTSLWIMPWGLVALVSAFLGLESIAIIPMQWGIDQLLALTQLISNWPNATRVIPSMHAISLVALTLMGLWLLLSQHPKRFIIALPAMMLLTVSGYLTPPPSIILHYDPIGRFAVRYNDGSMVFSTPPPGRFVRNIWLEKTASIHNTHSDRLHCDRFGCTTKLDDGRLAAFLNHPLLFAETCDTADLVVNFSYIRYKCDRKQQVISRYELWKEGKVRVVE